MKALKQIAIISMLLILLFTYIGYLNQKSQITETRKLKVVFAQNPTMVDLQPAEKLVNEKIQAKLEIVEEYQNTKAELHERAKTDYEAYLAELQRQRQIAYSQPTYTATTESSSSGSHAGTYELTAYTWTGNPCANGEYPTDGITIASNTLPLGTRVYIEGLGERVVQDTGGMGNGVIDVYMDSYDDCIQFGRQSADVYVLE